MNFETRCENVRSWALRGQVSAKEANKLVEEFLAMPGNGAGGILHIVIDDSNLEDHSIEWCIDQARIEGDRNARALGRLLLAMTVKQRLQVPKLDCRCGCLEDLRVEHGLPRREPAYGMVQSDVPGGAVFSFVRFGEPDMQGDVVAPQATVEVVGIKAADGTVTLGSPWDGWVNLVPDPGAIKR